MREIIRKKKKKNRTLFDQIQFDKFNKLITPAKKISVKI